MSIKSTENEKIMTRLVKEVTGLNPSFDGASIQGISIIIIHPYAHQQSCLQ